MEREIKEELASKESEASKAPSNERREASEDGGDKNVYKTNKQDPIHVMSQIPTLTHATPRTVHVFLRSQLGSLIATCVGILPSSSCCSAPPSSPSSRLLCFSAPPAASYSSELTQLALVVPLLGIGRATGDAIASVCSS